MKNLKYAVGCLLASLVSLTLSIIFHAQTNTHLPMLRSTQVIEESIFPITMLIRENRQIPMKR